MAKYLTKDEIVKINKFRKFWNAYFIIGIIASIFGVILYYNKRSGGEAILYLFVIGILLIYGAFLVKFRYNVIRSQFFAGTFTKKDITSSIPKSNFNFILGIVFILIGVLSIMVFAGVILGIFAYP